MATKFGNMETTILFGNEAEGEALSSRTFLPAPTVFTGQRLRGSVLISQHGSQRPEFDTVQLLLKGKVKNVIRQADGLCWEFEKPLVLMSCVKVAEDFQRLASEGDTKNRAGFFFDVPESITVPTYQRNLIHQLPPSIRVAKTVSSTDFQDRDELFGHCDVTYHIEARISRGGKVVGDARREIIVIPTAEKPPPLDPEHLKYEYRFSAASSLGSFWKTKKSITVSVATREPPPIVFPSLKGESTVVGTQLLLNFKVRKMYDMKEILIEPPVTECEVSVTLEAITYFLEQEKEQVLSIAETRQCPSAILKRKKFKTQKRKLKLEGWKRVIDTETDATRMIEWKTTTLLMTLLPEDVPRLPSFFSTLVSRRYAFDVQLVFGAKLGSKPVHLRIPVQIVHAPVEKHPDRPSHVEFEDDLKAPAYVP